MSEAISLISLAASVAAYAKAGNQTAPPTSPGSYATASALSALGAQLTTDLSSLSAVVQTKLADPAVRDIAAAMIAAATPTAAQAISAVASLYREGSLSDPSGLSVTVSKTAQPLVAIFGNSIASQAVPTLAAVNLTGSADTAAGATVLPVSGTVTAAQGAIVDVRSYDSSTESYTLASDHAAATALTLSAPLRKMVRASANYAVRVTPTVNTLRTYAGIGSIIVAQLSGRAAVASEGYGWGGSKIRQMLFDLPAFLDRVTTSFILLHLLENDVQVSSTSAESDIACLKQAVELVMKRGITPIVASPVPSDFYVGLNALAKFDAFTAYINGAGAGTLSSEYPGALALDCSSPWLLSTATARKPDPSILVTDGIHPAESDRAKAAMLAVGAPASARLRTVFASFTGGQTQVATAVNPNPKLELTSGGNKTGAGTLVGLVPDGVTIAVPTGVTATFSIAQDGACQLTLSVAGTADVTAHRVDIKQAITVPAGLQPSSRWLAFNDVTVIAASGYSMLYSQLAFSTGEVHAGFQSAWLERGAASVAGRVLRLETPPVAHPGAATATVSLVARPITGQVNSSVTLKLLSMCAGAAA